MRESICFVAIVLLSTVTISCRGLMVDDYPEARVVIDGAVLDAAAAPVPNARVEITAMHPPFLSGDTLLAGDNGRFRTALGTRGVSSFQADLRLRVSAAGTGSIDTVLEGIWLRDNHSAAAPSTVHVSVQLRP